MSSKSNNQGRAYEFSYLLTLFDEISKFRAVDINKNSSYFVIMKKNYIEQVL